MTIEEIIKLVYSRGVNCPDQPCVDWSDEKIIKESIQAVKDRVKEVMPKEKQQESVNMGNVDNLSRAMQRIWFHRSGHNQYHTEMDKAVKKL